MSRLRKIADFLGRVWPRMRPLFPKGGLSRADSRVVASVFTRRERRRLRGGRWDAPRISRFARRLLVQGEPEVARRWVEALRGEVEGFEALAAIRAFALDGRLLAEGYVEERREQALAMVFWGCSPQLEAGEEVDLASSDGERLAARVQPTDGVHPQRRWFAIGAAAFRPHDRRAPRVRVALRARLLAQTPRLRAVWRCQSASPDPAVLAEEISLACAGDGGWEVLVEELGVCGMRFAKEGLEELPSQVFLYLPLLVGADPALLFLSGRLDAQAGLLHIDELQRGSRELLLRVQVAAERTPAMGLESLLPQ